MQHYRIAGLTVAMESFGRTLTQAEPYRCAEDSPDIVISASWEPLHESQPHLSPEDCEYLATGGSFYRQLIRHNGLMLHASAVVKNGRAYLFSGPCGAGKSTHTALWRKTFGDDNVKILNDDKPALRLEDGQWFAYGTPWSGKTAQNLNLRVPLAGICFLGQAPENSIQPFGGAKAVFSLLEQTARPGGAELRAELMHLLDELIKRVPIWKMECNMEPEAAKLSYRVMSEYKKEK